MASSVVLTSVDVVDVEAVGCGNAAVATKVADTITNDYESISKYKINFYTMS